MSSMDRLMVLGVLSAIRIYLVRSPVEVGKFRLSGFGRRFLESRLHHSFRTEIGSRDGFRIEVDLNDWMGRYIGVWGEYEPATAKVFRRLLRSGDVFVDVGANIGYFSLLAASLVGGKGKVYSFEPNPSLFPFLEKNLLRNGYHWAIPHQLAVFDEVGEIEFHVAPSDHTGRSSIRRLEDAEETIRVRTVTLDEQLSDVDSLRLMKLDVEGAEQNALLGSRSLIERNRPCVVIEMTDRYLKEFGYSSEDVHRFFRELEYEHFAIMDDDQLLRNSPPQEANQYNALFVPGEMKNDILALCQ